MDWTLGLKSFLFGKDKGNLAAIGLPSEYKMADNEAVQGINLQPNTGSARKAFVLTRKSIPAPTSHAAMIQYVKEVRSQLRVRKVLEEIADQMTLGFRVKGNAETKALFNRLQLYGVVNRVFFELISLGWCVVYLSEPRDKNQFPTLTTMHNVEIRRALDGQFLTFLQLDTMAKEVVRANAKVYPDYWIKELEDNMGINITRLQDKSGKSSRGGAYFIRLGCDGEDIYPVPPLYPVLEYLIDSERTLDGAGGLLDILKSYLFHIQIGTKDGQDLRDGRMKPVSPERVNAIGSQVAAISQGGVLATAGDVSFNVITPGKDYYEGYQSNIKHYDQMLHEDTGLPYFETISSEGVASYVARQFLPTMEHLRVGIMEAQFLQPLLTDLAAKGVVGADKARLRWGVENVFDLRTIIERAKTQSATGGVSIRYINELLDADYDFDEELVQKQAELAQKDIIGMIWEPSQNLSVKALESGGGLSTPSLPEGTTGRPTN